MSSNTKLELTWIGKTNRPKLEPRILLEKPEKSYHARHRVTDRDLFDNRLIFGDNLLALKALEQEYTGRIKCAFIESSIQYRERLRALRRRYGAFALAVADAASPRAASKPSDSRRISLDHYRRQRVSLFESSMRRSFRTRQLRRFHGLGKGQRAQERYGRVVVA